MKWQKRLKWLRISKIVIPIALAISLVFAGFTVYGHEAENFVINVGNTDDVRLSLTLNRDLSEQTSHLVVPAGGAYKDVTYTPDKNLLYDSSVYRENLPDDIAKHDGVHSVKYSNNGISFYSFSFWLVNNSSRAVDVDMSMNIDSVTHGTNAADRHVDDAVRVMLIEGEPLLSEESYTVYKKKEKNEENQKVLDDHVEYKNVVDFVSDTCIFARYGDLGLRSFPAGATARYTVVIWLEGWDEECKDDIFGERMKMSINFTGK